MASIRSFTSIPGPSCKPAFVAIFCCGQKFGWFPQDLGAARPPNPCSFPFGGIVAEKRVLSEKRRAWGAFRELTRRRRRELTAQLRCKCETGQNPAGLVSWPSYGSGRPQECACVLFASDGLRVAVLGDQAMGIDLGLFLPAHADGNLDAVVAVMRRREIVAMAGPREVSKQHGMPRAKLSSEADFFAAWHQTDAGRYLQLVPASRIHSKRGHRQTQACHHHHNYRVLYSLVLYPSVSSPRQGVAL
jgi:hypothetical protein